MSTSPRKHRRSRGITVYRRGGKWAFIVYQEPDILIGKRDRMYRADQLSCCECRARAAPSGPPRQSPARIRAAAERNGSRLDPRTARFGSAISCWTVLSDYVVFKAWRRCGRFWSPRSVTAIGRYPPSAWNGSWNDAPDNPSVASASSEMTRAIRAASALGARSRTSCKRQSNVSRFLGVLPSCDASPPSPLCASGRQEEDDQPNCHARPRETPALTPDELKQRLQNGLDDRAITPRFVDLAEPSALPR